MIKDKIDLAVCAINQRYWTEFSADVFKQKLDTIKTWVKENKVVVMEEPIKEVNAVMDTIEKTGNKPFWRLRTYYDLPIGCDLKVISYICNKDWTNSDENWIQINELKDIILKGIQDVTGRKGESSGVTWFVKGIIEDLL